MPYTTNAELPKGVVHHLPAHAQDIYREAFNHSWEFYKDPAKRHPDSSLEETAHKVAWAAVEKKYHKLENGQWIENEVLA